MASFSCTPMEWEQIRARARRENKTVSAYVIERGLTVTPPMRERGEVRLVIPEEAQWKMLFEVTRLGWTFSKQLESDDPECPGMIAAIRSLFETKVQELLKTGRYEDLAAVLRPVVGDERADEIAAEAYETYLGRRGIQPSRD